MTPPTHVHAHTHRHKPTLACSRVQIPWFQNTPLQASVPRAPPGGSVDKGSSKAWLASQAALPFLQIPGSAHWPRGGVSWPPGTCLLMDLARRL